MAAKKEKKPVGRPSEYTKEKADEICEQLALGNSLRTVCEMKDMPSIATVFKWMRENSEFLKQYGHAKEESAEALNEVVLDLGDKAIAHAEEADVKASNAVVSAYKLKSDNLKWYMSKMKPKKYGDSIDVTSDHKALPTPIYGGLSIKNNGIQGHDGDKKDIPTPKKD